MFFGHTRFSLFTPSSGGWTATNGTRFTSVADYQDYLFSDARMQPRIDIFLNLSLPQIELASQGHDVTHVVAYPTELPAKHKARLREAARRFPFLVLDERGPGRKIVSPRALAAERYQASGDPFALYRLDDDDLLPTDYFAQVSPYVRPENAGMMVSLGSGAMALYSGGRYYNLRHSYVPMIAIGLLSVCRYENGELIEPARAPHNQSDRVNPVILDSRRLGYLWTRHVAQDSALRFGTPDQASLTELLLGFMDKHPAATPEDGFEAAFPAAAHAFTGRQRPDSRSLQELTPGRSLTNDPTDLPISPVEGGVTLTFDVTAPQGRGKNNMLASLSVADASGRMLEPARDRDWLTGTGVSVSNNTSIGYFCYVSVRAGSHRVQHKVQLPEGFSLRGLSVRRFATKAMDVRLQRLLVEEHP